MKKTVTLPGGRKVPVIPPRPAVPEKPPLDTNPVTAVCGACGTHLRRVMHFFCPRGDCPVQTKFTWRN